MKKLLSLVAAAAMAFSMLSPFATTAFAEGENPTPTATVEPSEEPDATASPEPSTTPETTPSATPETTPSATPDATATIAPTPSATPEPTATTEPTPSATPDTTNEETFKEVAALFAALPKAEDAKNLSKEEAQTLFDQVVAAFNAFDDKVDWTAVDQFKEQYGDLYDNADKLGGVLNDIIYSDNGGNSDEPAVMSLLPLPETFNVYVTLTGRSKAELQNFSVKEFLSLMKDYSGETVEPIADATYAEFQFVDEGREETKKSVDVDGVIDLWTYYSYYADEEDASTSYRLVMVLNNGNQLDTEGHRYHITVQINTTGVYSCGIYPRVKRQTSASSWMIGSPELYTTESSDIFDTIGIPGEILKFWTEGTAISWIKLDGYGFDDLSHDGITVKAYPMSDYLKYGANVVKQGTEVEGLLTSSGDGCTADVSTEITADNYTTAPNLWCLVYLDKDGRILGYLGVGMVGEAVNENINGGNIDLTLWSYENGTMVNVGTGTIYTYDDEIWYNVDTTNTTASGVTLNGTTSSGKSWHNYSITLAEGYTTEQDYYLTMSGGSIQTAKNGKTGEDLTAALFCDTSNTSVSTPFGYKANFDYTTYDDTPSFELTRKYGNSLYSHIWAYEQSSTYYDSRTTYFRIQGANDADGNALDTAAPYVSGVPLDTYYSYNSQYEVGGYQVLLIQDDVDDLKSIKPIFSIQKGVTAQNGSVVAESGQTDLEKFVWQDLDGDGVDDTVIYNVHIPGNKVQNYMVTFVKKQTGVAKLYVAGPDERYVVLNEDSNDRHDVMIANVGNQDLTGLTVTLEDAQNVKLDSYWIVGGDGNETLTGFNTTEKRYKNENGDDEKAYSSYATIANIAKIRLLKDGDGDVSGTLVIKSANGGERRIKLTGVAGKPKLLDADLEPAVKYVHYSYMLSTNNMYRDNTVTFAVVDGALPNGVSIYQNTGEIYGVPQEAGDFTFTVEATNSMKGFGTSRATYTLHVDDNTNANVYLASDIADGYDIQIPLGVEQGAGTYDFLVSNPDADQLYVSNGVIEEFQSKASINGQDLQDISAQLGFTASDISYVSGSTRLTISGQAFRKMINAGIIYTDTPNTISMEFRVGGVATNEMKRTAQNFRIADVPEQTNTNNNSQSSSQNSGSTDTTSAAESSPAALVGSGSEAQYLKSLRVIVLDASGARQPGLTVQLHSSVRTGVTGSDGSITFYNVEFGKHNLTIKNANGDVLATKDFTISAGTATVTLDGVTAPGGSDMSIEVKLDGNGGMTFTQMSAGKVPSTGDDFDPKLWAALLCLSGLALTGLAVRRKRQK